MKTNYYKWKELLREIIPIYYNKTKIGMIVDKRIDDTFLCCLCWTIELCKTNLNIQKQISKAIQLANNVGIGFVEEIIVSKEQLKQLLNVDEYLHEIYIPRQVQISFFGSLAGRN